MTYGLALGGNRPLHANGERLGTGQAAIVALVGDPIVGSAANGLNGKWTLFRR